MPQQSFRVLLVEDDDSLRVCLGEFLADHGWQVEAAARGCEAIELARTTRFDFSILDFHLPDGTTGLEVFRRICQVRPLPAILMSGAADREETTQALRAGVFTFLRKPLDLVRLRHSVQLLIQHHFGGPLLLGDWPATPAPRPQGRPSRRPLPPAPGRTRPPQQPPGMS
ncbi:MAG: response regulator [Planctomycetota bacterium]